MAEIIAKFDTKTKKLEISKDGELLENVARCSFGMNYEGEYMCAVDMMHKDKEHSTMESKTLYASKTPENDKLVADMIKFLSKRNGK